MKTDMSEKAVTTRLKRTSQLRRVCLSLAKAGKGLPESRPAKIPSSRGPAKSQVHSEGDLKEHNRS